MATQTYTTVSGDTLSSIAQHFYGDPNRWPEIYAANSSVIGGDPSALAVGAVLTIPNIGEPTIGPNDPFSWYTVQPGETLFDIGVRVSGGDTNYWQQLYAINRDIIGPDPNVIQPGMRIRIPQQSGGNPPPGNIGNWQRIGGNIASGAGAVFYRGTDHVFAAGNTGTLLHYFGGTWEDMTAAPGGVVSSPGVTLRGPNALHAAVRSTDTHMYQRFWDGQRWSGWQALGGDLASGPALASWNEGRLDCFARGMFQNLIHVWWEVSSGWSAWQDMGPILPTRYDIQFEPAAVSWGPNRIDVFAVKADDGHMIHCWWDGSRWNGWEDMGGILTAAPTVLSRGVNRLDCFGRGTDGQVYYKAWNGTSWSNWRGLGGLALASAPAATATAGGIAIYGRGVDGALWRAVLR